MGQKVNPINFRLQVNKKLELLVGLRPIKRVCRGDSSGSRNPRVD